MLTIQKATVPIWTVQKKFGSAVKAHAARGEIPAGCQSVPDHRRLDNVSSEEERERFKEKIQRLKERGWKIALWDHRRQNYN